LNSVHDRKFPKKIFYGPFYEWELVVYQSQFLEIEALQQEDLAVFVVD